MERNRVINKIWDTSYICTITVWRMNKKVKSTLVRVTNPRTFRTHTTTRYQSTMFPILGLDRGSRDKGLVV